MNPGQIINGTMKSVSAIEFDNSNNNDGALCNSNSCSINLTVASGANRMIIVAIEAEGTLSPVTSIDNTGGTNQGILVGNVQVGSGSSEQNVEMWRIMESNIIDGVNTITVHFTAVPPGAGISVMSFSGVKQQPEEAENSNFVTNNDTITTGITTLSDGALIVSVVGNGQGGGTYTSHGLSQTERQDFATSSAWLSVTTEIKPSAGFDDQSHIFSISANRQAQYVAVFAPATTTGTINIEFDNSNNNDGALCNSNSCSINLTVASGANRMIIVAIEAEGTLSPVTSIDNTGGTNQGILVGNVQVGSGSSEQNVEMWRIMESNIIDGVNTITVHFTAVPPGAGISVMSFSGVKQQPEEAENSNFVTNNDTITTGITTLSDGALIVSVVGNGQGGGTYTSHGLSQTERQDFATSSAWLSVTTEIKPSAGFDDQSHIFSISANRQAQYVAVFAPASFSSRMPYEIKAISSKGTTVVDDLYVGDSGPPYKLRTELFAIPPDVKSGQNVTLAMFVTNISNDPLVSVTPAFPTPNTSHPANIDAITSPFPSSYNLSPNETVLFKWQAKVSSLNKTKVSFTNYATAVDPLSNSYEQGNPSNDYMNILGISGTTISGKGYSIIKNPEDFTSAELFSIIPSPFGASAQKGLWGVNVVNPTDHDLYVEKVVISIVSPRDGITTSSDQVFQTTCAPTTVAPTPSNWRYTADNQIRWQNFGTPVKVDPKSVFPFLVRVTPGVLFNNSNVSSFMVQTTVYTDIGIFTKTSFSSMQYSGATKFPIVNTFLTTDKNDAVNPAKIITRIIGIPSNSIQTFNATLADFDTVTSNYIDSAGTATKLIINVPPGWSDITIVDATGFSVNTIAQPNGSTQIIGDLTSNITGGGANKARVIQFTANAPTVLEDKLYVMYLKANGIVQSPAFSIDPVTPIILQVKP